MKRICSTLLVVALCFSLAVSAFAAAPVEFTDAKDIQYWNAVASLTQLGIISGKDDGSFDPDGNVTRAEAAKMIALIKCGNYEFDSKAKEPPTFSDIQGHWAEAYIEFCADRAVVNGNGSGSFNPDNNITVLELYKMALAALGHDPEAYALVGSTWADQVIEQATKMSSNNGVKLSEGLINVEEMDFYQPASREVVAQILYNTLRSNYIALIPGGKNDSGDVIWEYRPTSATLLQLHFGLDEWPAIPTRPEQGDS